MVFPSTYFVVRSYLLVKTQKAAMRMSRPRFCRQCEVALALGLMLLWNVLSLRQRVTITKQFQQQHEALVPTFNRTHCSCETPFDTLETPAERRACCDRRVIGAHKMGWQLLIQLSRQFFMRCNTPRKPDLCHVLQNTMDIDPPKRLEDYNTILALSRNASIDHRHVFLTRNWYDALISGYLYHKSGRECWLSSGGRGNVRGWGQDFDVVEFIDKQRNQTTTHPATTKQWQPPPAMAPGLCNYLLQHDETDGMRAYIEIALERWMRPLLQMIQYKQAHPFSRQRTHLVCYNHIVTTTKTTQSPETPLFSTTIHDIGNFLYPAEQHNDNEKWQNVYNNETSYSAGGHGTSHNVTLRQGLYQIIQEYDKNYLQGEIDAGSRALGCISELDERMVV